MPAAITIIAVVLTALVVALAFVTSAAEAAVRALPLARVRRLREAGDHGSRALDEISERPSHLGAAHALVSGLCFAVTSAALLWLLEAVWLGVPRWADLVVAVIISAVVLFALGEALPRSLAAANPESFGLATAGAAGVVVAVFYPLARALSAPWTGATRLITGEHAPDVPWADMIETARASGEDESAPDAEEEDMMEAVAGLEQKVVREVMIPRTDMIAIEDTATIAEALAEVVAAGVSRVPVFHDTLDDIRGILYAKDLLPALADPTSSATPIELVRPALFVPETKPVEDLLREMRRRTHIAIVADEYGGTAGLVTIEDLLEEIVGEIFDEYDPQVAMITQLPDGRTRIDARLAIDELDERFGTALDVDADTAGGLVTEIAGRIPQVGDSVEVEGLRFTVDEMEGNRVRQLLVEPAPAHEEENEE